MKTLPEQARRWLRVRRVRLHHKLTRTRARHGALFAVEPIRRNFGSGAGKCVDRYYIEGFLARHVSDIRGEVLEVGSDIYTVRFGGDVVAHSHVLHAVPGNPRATIVGDLTRGDGLPSDYFDCIVLTQTLQFIDDVAAALSTLYRMLKPGGVLLATVPGISQISRYDMDRWGEHWRFTSLSARALFDRVFPDEMVEVEAYGNVLAAVAFLHGLVTDELEQGELDHLDRDYELLITIRAVKPVR